MSLPLLYIFVSLSLYVFRSLYYRIISARSSANRCISSCPTIPLCPKIESNLCTVLASHRYICALHYCRSRSSYERTSSRNSPPSICSCKFGFHVGAASRTRIPMNPTPFPIVRGKQRKNFKQEACRAYSSAIRIRGGSFQ
jgi:hypothetical protein